MKIRTVTIVEFGATLDRKEMGERCPSVSHPESQCAPPPSSSLLSRTTSLHREFHDRGHDALETDQHQTPWVPLGPEDLLTGTDRTKWTEEWDGRLVRPFQTRKSDVDIWPPRVREGPPAGR